MTDPVYSHIMNTDGSWGTSRFQTPAATLTLPVHKIHFAAHHNIHDDGSDNMPPTNHWSMFLETSSTSSVRVEVVPGCAGSPGMVVLETKGYATTERASRTETAVSSPGMTVSNILSVIISKKRDRYIFHPVGEGCCFWLATLAVDLADAGVISSADAARIRNSLAMYWPFNNRLPAEQRPMSEGQFY
ncbi:hypothetical protein DICSQDRAFT_144699 [Dichomitus squalens LYAD-421 SS1]|nr:uncharacterized protein DICSQDRAFT_144699 [Dichomitus squalens LYAD-421 SS1]EJF64981.1 hypothetical protein DICSQDRAFT_144699 [Dichomitus squalens LYAD-421 SS1]